VFDEDAPVGVCAGTRLETVPACNLCGSRERRVAQLWSDRLLLRDDETWKLAECVSCGLLFLDPRPTVDAIGSYYPSDYLPHSDPPRQPSRWHRRVSAPEGTRVGALERLWLHIRQSNSWYYFPRWRGEGRVLDVGCGNGARYLDVLKGLGWTTHGIDASPAAVAAATAKGHEVALGTAESECFPEASMDVVTMWHTLEHTHCPHRALTAARRVLKPGGIVSLAVPNYDSLQRRLHGRFWTSTDVPRHLYQFRKRTLRRYFDAAGLRVVSMHTRTDASSWPRALRFVTNALFGTRLNRDPRWLVNAFEPLSALGSLVRHLGIGGEIRVIATHA